METVDANHGTGTLRRRAIALRIPWWADGGWRISAKRLARAQTRTLSFAHWAARRSGGRLVLWCSAGNESKSTFHQRDVRRRYFNYEWQHHDDQWSVCQEPRRYQ